MYDCHCAQMQRMLRWERYKGGSIYRLLRDNVYLTKEYILKNIFFSHARAKGVCV